MKVTKLLPILGICFLVGACVEEEDTGGDGAPTAGATCVAADKINLKAKMDQATLEALAIQLGYPASVVATANLSTVFKVYVRQDSTGKISEMAYDVATQIFSHDVFQDDLTIAVIAYNGVLLYTKAIPEAHSEKAIKECAEFVETLP